MPDTRECFAEGCTTPVQGSGHFCPRHWGMLTTEFRGALVFSGGRGAHDHLYQNLQAAKTYLKQREADLQNSVAIGGKTYPHREKLKALGGVWDAGAKVWRVPKSQSAAARAIVGGGQRETLPGLEAQ